MMSTNERRAKRERLLDPSIVRALFYLDDSDESPLLRWRNHASRAARKGDVAGCLDSNGYRAITFRGEAYLAHRLVFAYINGRWPRDQLDHINGIRDDNRIENLREASQQENNRNISRAKNNSSGVTGVHWSAKDKRWQAAIKAEGRSIYLGMFTDLKDAAKARKEAEAKYGFHLNHGRDRHQAAKEGK